jgi:hypothetical protein
VAIDYSIQTLEITKETATLNIMEALKKIKQNPQSKDLWMSLI